MKIIDIVKQLRELAAECEDESVLLPVEIVSVIHHDDTEVELVLISTQKVLQYVADMMEE